MSAAKLCGLVAEQRSDNFFGTVEMLIHNLCVIYTSLI